MPYRFPFCEVAAQNSGSKGTAVLVCGQGAWRHRRQPLRPLAFDRFAAATISLLFAKLSTPTSCVAHSVICFCLGPVPVSAIVPLCPLQLSTSRCHSCDFADLQSLCFVSWEPLSNIPLVMPFPSINPRALQTSTRGPAPPDLSVTSFPTKWARLQWFL